MSDRFTVLETYFAKEVMALNARVEELQAEVERLQAALEAMMAAAGDFAGDYSFGPLSPSLVCPTARDTWLGS